MLKLNIDPVIDSPSIKVRWCLDKEFLADLKLSSNEELFVLLLVRINDEYVWDDNFRTLVRAENLETHVIFSTPGEFYITGYLVKHHREGSLTAFSLLKHILINKRGGHYSDLNKYDGDDLVPMSYWINSEYFVTGPSRVVIEVPEDCFAPEPPAWEQNWVNMFYPTDPRDQCEYRRRRIIAYTLKPIIMLLYLIFAILARTLVATVMLVFGWWNISLRPLVSYFNYGIDDIWYGVCLTDNTYLRVGNWLADVFIWPFRKLARVFPKKKKTQPKERKVVKLANNNMEAYRFLSCEYEDRPATELVSVPRKIVLQYNDIKRKVCKPFRQ